MFGIVLLDRREKSRDEAEAEAVASPARAPGAVDVKGTHKHGENGDLTFRV